MEKLIMKVFNTPVLIFKKKFAFNEKNFLFLNFELEFCAVVGDSLSSDIHQKMTIQI